MLILWLLLSHTNSDPSPPIIPPPPLAHSPARASSESSPSATQRWVDFLVLDDPPAHTPRAAVNSTWRPGTRTVQYLRSPDRSDWVERWYRIRILRAVSSDQPWIIYDVEVQSEHGELRIPLLRSWRQGGVWQTTIFDLSQVQWLHRLATLHALHCHALCDDGNTSHSFGFVAPHSNDWARKPNPVPWFTCALHPHSTPPHVNVTVSDVELGFSDSVLLPLQRVRQHAHYAVVQLKAVWNMDVEEWVDWIHYHYAIGFDHLLPPPLRPATD